MARHRRNAWRQARGKVLAADGGSVVIRSAVKLGELYASRGDSVGGAPERFVEIGELHIDMDARRAVSTPLTPPGRVRLVHGRRAWESGILAERSDGAVLRLEGKTEGLGVNDLPYGPLFWRPSPSSVHQ